MRRCLCREVQSFGAGIQPHEVQCESPSIGVGFGHEVHLAPLGDTKLQQCLSLRANHSLFFGRMTDASSSADRPLSPSDRRLLDVAILMMRRCLFTPYTVSSAFPGTLMNPRNESSGELRATLSGRISNGSGFHSMSSSSSRVPRDEAHPFTRLGVSKRSC